MKPTLALRSFLLGSSLLAAVTTAHATIWIWDAGGADNRWQNGPNWVGNVEPGFGAANGVEFYSGALVAGDLTTFLMTGTTIGSLAFNAAADLGVSIKLASNADATSNLTLGSGSVTPTITVDAGSSGNHLIGSTAHGSVILANNLTVTHDGSGTLTIARPVTGATFGITKAGTGTMILSGANTYSGATQVDGGILGFANKSALGNTAVTAAAAGSLGLGVKTSDAAYYSATDVGDLFNTNTLSGFSLNAASGVAIDTTNSGGSFDQTVALTAARALTKIGTGTLVLSAPNTYNGGTTVSTGVLTFLNTSAKSSSGTHAFAAGATLGLGVATSGSFYTSTDIGKVFAGTMTGNLSGITVTATTHVGIDTTAGDFTYSTQITGAPTRGLVKLGTGTLTLNAAAVNTYTGTTRIDTGTLLMGDGTGANGSLSNATQSIVIAAGATFAYNRTDTVLQAAATQLGATSVFSGAGSILMLGGNSGTGEMNLRTGNTYSGTTTILGGTLSFGGADASILNTSGITFGGGTLRLDNAAHPTQVTANRISNTAPITSNGGTINYNNTSAATNSTFAETIGSVGLASGQFNIVESTNQNSSAANAQTLTLAGLTRTGAGNTSAITFSAAGTGPQAAGLDNMIVVTASGTTSGWVSGAASNPIIGPWATTGTAANAQTDYAVYNGNYVVPSATADSAETTWTDSTKAYMTSTGGTVTLTAPRSMTALLNTGATTVLTLANGANLETYGLLNGVSTLLTVAPGTGGSLTTPAGGGDIHVTTGSGAIALNAPIIDNGTVGLVKNGTGGTLTLTAANNYSGATTVNAGTLALGASNVLPDATAVSIGTATLNAATFDDTVGTLDVMDTATINLGAGANLIFADSSAIDWSGGKLNITGTFVSTSSLKFGITSGGLTAAQLAVISVNGAGAGTYTLNANGYLIAPGGGNTYADWLVANAPATGFNTDSDNDGIPNGVENVLGSNPNTFNTGLTEVSSTANSVTFEHTLNPSVASDVTYSYEWSTDLVEWKTSGQTNTGGITGTISAPPAVLGVVTVTITTDIPSTRLFGRLTASQ